MLCASGSRTLISHVSLPMSVQDPSQRNSICVTVDLLEELVWSLCESRVCLKLAVLLEETHADIDSQNLALWHLSNSIQHKLGQVIFSENAMSRGGNFLKLFFRILRQTKLLRARKDQTRYTSCQVIVVDQARQVVSSANGPPDFSCSKCNNIYCRKGSCAMSVRECHYSGQTLCADSDPLEQCDQCGKTPCDKCNEIPI